MTPNQYPEIKVLEDFIKKYKVKIEVSQKKILGPRKDFPAVQLEILGQSFSLFAEDEYADFKLGDPRLSLCVVLRSLEDYEFADDYLVWCKQNGLSSLDEVIRSYYMDLGRIYPAIEKLVGKIESQISDHDFTLSAAAARELRKR